MRKFLRGILWKWFRSGLVHFAWVLLQFMADFMLGGWRYLAKGGLLLNTLLFCTHPCRISVQFPNNWESDFCSWKSPQVWLYSPSALPPSEESGPDTGHHVWFLAYSGACDGDSTDRQGRFWVEILDLCSTTYRDVSQHRGTKPSAGHLTFPSQQLHPLRLRTRDAQNIRRWITSQLLLSLHMMFQNNIPLICIV